MKQLLGVFVAVLAALAAADTSYPGVASTRTAAGQRTVHTSLPPTNRVDCASCFYKENSFLRACFEPVLDLVDHEDTCQWRNAAELNIEVVSKCIKNIIGIGDTFLTYKLDKLCTALNAWMECVKTRPYITSQCMCSASPFFYYIETLDKYCEYNILPAYWDCTGRVNVTTATLAQQTPRPECDLHSGERLSLQWLTLRLLYELMTYTPNFYSVGDSRAGDIVAREYCTQIQLDACLERRQQMVLCPAMFPLNMSAVLDQLYGHSVQEYSQSTPQFAADVKRYCRLQPSTFTVKLLQDVNDITAFYNQTSRPVFIRLLQDSARTFLNFNLTSTKCDVKNLIFKQSGCVNKIIALLDLSQITFPSYMGEYLQKHMQVYDSCWAVYRKACVREADRLNYTTDFLHGYASMVAFKSQCCPVHTLLYETYSSLSVWTRIFSSFIDLIYMNWDTLRGTQHYNNGDISKSYLLLGLTYTYSKLATTSALVLADPSLRVLPVYEKLCGRGTAAAVNQHFVKTAASYKQYKAIQQNILDYLKEL